MVHSLFVRATVGTPMLRSPRGLASCSVHTFWHGEVMTHLVMVGVALYHWAEVSASCAWRLGRSFRLAWLAQRGLGRSLHLVGLLGGDMVGRFACLAGTWSAARFAGLLGGDMVGRSASLACSTGT
jgi:hypothetical protein